MVGMMTLTNLIPSKTVLPVHGPLILFDPCHCVGSLTWCEFVSFHSFILYRDPVRVAVLRRRELVIHLLMASLQSINFFIIIAEMATDVGGMGQVHERQIQKGTCDNKLA